MIYDDYHHTKDHLLLVTTVITALTISSCTGSTVCYDLILFLGWCNFKKCIFSLQIIHDMRKLKGKLQVTHIFLKDYTFEIKINS